MRCQREPAIYRLVFYKGNEVAPGARSQNGAWEEDGKCTAEGTGQNQPQCSTHPQKESWDLEDISNFSKEQMGILGYGKTNEAQLKGCFS